MKLLPGAHKGAVSKIKFFSDYSNNNLIMSTGLKDGFITCHDMRMHTPVFSKQMHSGAINMLQVSSQSYCITGAADK